MENKKITLWVIIVLLIVILPVTIFSTIMHFRNDLPQEENKNHEFKLNGKLYFYQNNKLLGTYDCKNKLEFCDYAKINNDSTYSLDERKIESDSKLPIINNRFVFLMDDKVENPNILLYDINAHRVMGEYKEVKNYGIGIDNNYYILKNQNDLWGVVSLEDGINLELPFGYDFIGLTNKINPETNKIEAEIFAVLKDNKWQLIDISGAMFTDLLDAEIFSYNTAYVIVKQQDFMQLFDFNGNPKLSNYKYINFYNKFLKIIDMNNNFYLYDLSSQRKISNTYMVNDINDIELKIEDNKIQIYRNDELEESIEIE